MQDVITRVKIENMVGKGQKEIFLPSGTILTQMARAWIKEHDLQLTFTGHDSFPKEVEMAASDQENDQQRAIVTVLGHDRVGITASVAGVLADYQVNIMDITQTILREFFAMNMIVDLSTCPVDFAQLRATLEEMGEAQELKITIQHEDIFRFMHRV